MNNLIATWADEATSHAPSVPSSSAAPVPATCSDTRPAGSRPPLGFVLTEVTLIGSAYRTPAASASGAAFRRFSVGDVVSVSHRLFSQVVNGCGVESR